jgi:sugar transferase (PEP-CTERM/EpsH1 system associated)
MKNILFLVHRIPYPPNKGDKIRSFNFLKALSQEFNVYLGAFVDDDEDWQYQETLQTYCKEVFCLGLNPRSSKIKSLKGFLTGQALSLPYYENRQMQTWVDNTIDRQQIKDVLIFSSVMAQFVLKHRSCNIIADYVDVDSDKWRQYAEKKRWPENWIYRRESRKLLTYEKKTAVQTSATAFVSEQEAKLFKQLAPEVDEKVIALNNGVDTDFFNPELLGENPYLGKEKVIVFTGAMDYWANVDAVVWFANEVFPEIRQHHPDVLFYIVGSKPSNTVSQLGELDNIVVTGRVDDIRPYLAFAELVVAPLRIARGIQNKVLEAMAMGKIVLATSAAMEGIPDYQDQDVVMTDNAVEFAAKALTLLESPQEPKYSANNRLFVESGFSWNTSGIKLINLLN